MNKKLTLAASLLVAIAACIALAAGTYHIVSVPMPGKWAAAGITVGKAQQIICEGSAVTTGTVMLYRMSADGTSSNLLVTVTNASGACSYDISGLGVWLKAGDVIFRTGTSTNGPCWLILAQ
jgi:hypothetical protein